MVERAVLLAWLLAVVALSLVAGSYGMMWVGVVGYPHLAWSVVFVVLLAVGGVLVLRGAARASSKAAADAGSREAVDG